MVTLKYYDWNQSKESQPTLALLGLSRDGKDYRFRSLKVIYLLFQEDGVDFKVRVPSSGPNSTGVIVEPNP